MTKLKRIFINWKLYCGLITVLIIIVVVSFIANYNFLSKYETMDKFLNLVSNLEYEEAKKYITENFKWNLVSIREKKLEYADSFIYKYEEYYLDNDYDIAYIDINLKETRFMAIYKFKLKQTISGYKIDDYEYEYVNY